MTVLSVNLNKIAVLRNARGGALPDVLVAARTVVDAGCGGVTVHPRPDCRHIRPDDVIALAEAGLGVELNIEGNPFAGPRPGYPGFIELALAARPAQVTLVPDSDAQLTSDHGWDLARDGERLRPLIGSLHDHGARVSLFMDCGIDDIEAAAELGADRIELYTGPYAHAYARGAPKPELDRCAGAAERARRCGLAVNAGHDLDQRNLGALLHVVPDIAEVSIGHALIGEALYDGLAETVRRYLRIIDAASAPH